MKSLNDSIYSAIFSRQSIRSYSDTTITPEILEKLKKFVLEVPPLLISKPVAFDIQTHKGSTMKLAVYAESDPESYINLAFMLEQIALFLQTNGIGTLWNATIRSDKKQYQGLPHGVCLVFGIPKGNLVRTDISQFDRKNPEEISNKPELPLIEAVRLAPSARNRQPWYLVCEQNCIHFYCSEGGFLDKTLLRNLHWFDLGIAVCHAVLALKHEGSSPVATIKPSIPERKGYIYGISLDY